MSWLGVILAAAVSSTPAFAYLAPAGDVWQVWASPDGGKPKPITSDPVEKIALSASARTGEILALTRSGRALLLRPGGEIVRTIELGAGAADASLAPDSGRVAFTREEVVGQARQRRLWVVERGGGEPRQVAEGSGLQHSPAWSPDGAALAFTATGDGGGEDVWWARADGGGEQQLTAGPPRHFEPSVAPGGAIFLSYDHGGDYDIGRLDPAGGALTPVISRPGYDGQPSVSPSGDRILFVSGRDGHRAVWLANSDGSGARPLTAGATDVRHPIWLASAAAGPDPAKDAPRRAGAPAAEGWIVFLRVTEGNWQPWVSRPDGSKLRQVAHLPVDVSRLTVSADGRALLADTLDGTLFMVTMSDGTARRVKVDPPGPTDAALSSDGRRIAYSVNTLGGVDSNDLWVVAAEGGRARKLTDQPFLQHFPAWGAGDEILYLSGQGGQSHDIWRVRADKGDPRLVLGEHLYNFEPAASSSGDVAFSSNREENYEIWLLPAGAKEPRRLTHDPAYDGQPTFSPDGKRIAFVSLRGGTSRIRIYDLESGSETELPVEGELRMPFWYAGQSGIVARGGAPEGR